MDLKQLEATITDLKSKVSSEKKDGAGRALVRKTRKRLKRAQRKKCVMVTKASSLSDKSKKKGEAASE